MRVENKRHTNAHQPLTSPSPTEVLIPPSPPEFSHHIVNRGVPRFVATPVTEAIRIWRVNCARKLRLWHCQNSVEQVRAGVPMT
jgi:hypothetical protein